jgi:hypothetical protein
MTQRSVRNAESGIGKPLVAVAAVVAVCAGGFNIIAAGWVCDQDTSYCAFSHDRDGFYTGILADRDGTPLVNRRFSFVVESRRELRAPTLQSGTAGRVCVLWPQERGTPLALAGGAATSLRRWTAVRDSPAPAGCSTSDAAIPWNRADDLTSRWQFLAVLALSLVSVATLLASATTGGRRAPTLRLAAVVLASAAGVLCVAVWQ